MRRRATASRISCGAAVIRPSFYSCDSTVVLQGGLDIPGADLACARRTQHKHANMCSHG